MDITQLCTQLLIQNIFSYPKTLWSQCMQISYFPVHIQHGNTQRKVRQTIFSVSHQRPLPLRPATSIASFPGPRPASRRLQYVLQATGSWAGAWERGYRLNCHYRRPSNDMPTFNGRIICRVYIVFASNER